MLKKNPGNKQNLILTLTSLKWNVNHEINIRMSDLYKKLLIIVLSIQYLGYLPVCKCQTDLPVCLKKLCIIVLSIQCMGYLPVC